MITIREQPAIDRTMAASLERIRAEYHDLPGLSLTQPQMQRLLGVDARTCRRVVDTLTAAHVLRKTRTGRYITA